MSFSGPLSKIKMYSAMINAKSAGPGSSNLDYLDQIYSQGLLLSISEEKDKAKVMPEALLSVLNELKDIKQPAIDDEKLNARFRDYKSTFEDQKTFEDNLDSTKEYLDLLLNLHLLIDIYKKASGGKLEEVFLKLTTDDLTLLQKKLRVACNIFTSDINTLCKQSGALRSMGDNISACEQVCEKILMERGEAHKQVAEKQAVNLEQMLIVNLSSNPKGEDLQTYYGGILSEFDALRGYEFAARDSYFSTLDHKSTEHIYNVRNVLGTRMPQSPYRDAILEVMDHYLKDSKSDFTSFHEQQSIKTFYGIADQYYNNADKFENFDLETYLFIPGNSKLSKKQKELLGKKAEGVTKTQVEGKDGSDNKSESKLNIYSLCKKIKELSLQEEQDPEKKSIIILKKHILHLILPYIEKRLEDRTWEKTFQGGGLQRLHAFMIALHNAENKVDLAEALRILTSGKESLIAVLPAIELLTTDMNPQASIQKGLFQRFSSAINDRLNEAIEKVESKKKAVPRPRPQGKRK